MSINETAERDPWDNNRKAQVQLIIAASHNVTKAEEVVGKAHSEVWRLERELEKAKAAHGAAVQERDARTEKVAGYVRAYSTIGAEPETANPAAGGSTSFSAGGRNDSAIVVQGGHPGGGGMGVALTAYEDTPTSRRHRRQETELRDLIDSPDFRIAGGFVKVSSLRALLGDDR